MSLDVKKDIEKAVADAENMTKKYNKPPLGVPPYWIAIDARIREVGGAISRYDSSIQDIKNVEAWAEELLAYCNTVNTIKRIQNKYKDGYVPF